MESNKAEQKEKENKGPCCHCCDKCFPREKKEKGYTGKCRICSQLGRPCPFGMDLASENDIRKTTHPNLETLKKGMERLIEPPANSPLTNPTTTIPIVNSQVGRPTVLLNYRPVSVSRAVPVYPVFEVRPVYYNVTVPIRLSDLGRGPLAKSTVQDPEQRKDKGILVKQNVDVPNKMKHSSSTFDRSKMKQSLMSSRSKKAGEPLSPEEMRIIVKSFSQF